MMYTLLIDCIQRMKVKVKAKGKAWGRYVTQGGKLYVTHKFKQGSNVHVTQDLDLRYTKMEPEFLSNLSVFYQHLFPFKLLSKWLAYQNGK